MRVCQLLRSVDIDEEVVFDQIVRKLLVSDQPVDQLQLGGLDARGLDTGKRPAKRVSW